MSDLGNIVYLDSIPTHALSITTSSRGRAFIESYEQCRLTAYADSGGVWTVGYGHTGPDVKQGTVITCAHASELLAWDLVHTEIDVARLVKVALTENQADALVAFAFNVGTNALANSTLLRLLNAGDYAGAAKQFARWNKCKGKVLGGLTARRAGECSIFETGTYVYHK